MHAGKPRIYLDGGQSLESDGSLIETVGNEEDGYEEVYPVLLLGNYPIWKKGGH